MANHIGLHCCTACRSCSVLSTRAYTLSRFGFLRWSHHAVNLWLTRRIHHRTIARRTCLDSFPHLSFQITRGVCTRRCRHRTAWRRGSENTVKISVSLVSGRYPVCCGSLGFGARVSCNRVSSDCGSGRLICREFSSRCWRNIAIALTTPPRGPGWVDFGGSQLVHLITTVISIASVDGAHNENCRTINDVR